MHEVDESMYDSDTARHGIGRESAHFDQMLQDEAEIAHKMLEDMGITTTAPDAGFVPSLYEDMDETSRTERLHDDIIRETEIAEEIMRSMIPRLYDDVG